MSTLESYEAQKALSERLEKLGTVSSFGDADEPGGWRLAYSLAHLEESFTRYLTELLPQVVRASNHDDIRDALVDIGVELGHIEWHMRNPNFFDAFLIDKGPE